MNFSAMDFSVNSTGERRVSQSGSATFKEALQ